MVQRLEGFSTPDRKDQTRPDQTTDTQIHIGNLLATCWIAVDIPQVSDILLEHTCDFKHQHT